MTAFPSTPNYVIPAKAGIHGLTTNFATSRLVKPKGSAMDSRLRGNDKVCMEGGNAE